MVDEPVLIERARKGSPEAFSELVRLHQVRVRSYLARVIRRRDLIDDLAQETFLAAYRTLDSYRGDSALGGWLLAIARNQALMHLRRERLRAASTLDETVTTWLADDFTKDAPDARHEREVDALQKCLAGLPPTSASIVDEHYAKRHSAIDIARRLGKSAGAVWMTLMRVRQALRECMQKRLANG